MPKASESYNLHVLRPDLAKEWHPSKNGALGPKDVTLGSRKKVWWLCDHGHWWLASVSDRVRGMKCTYCRDLKVLDERRMIDVKPDLLKEWHTSKNKDIKANEVPCTHSDKVWWLCKNGHEWQATIRTKLSGKLCPHCSSLTPKDLNRESSETGKLRAHHGKLSTYKPLGPLHEQESIHYQGKELRKSKRYEHVSTVMIESFQAGIFGYAQMNNYSAGGMSIRSDFPISPGALLKIRLEKPLYASVSDVVDSRVIWCKEIEDDSEMNSRFAIGMRLI